MHAQGDTRWYVQYSIVYNSPLLGINLNAHEHEMKYTQLGLSGFTAVIKMSASELCVCIWMNIRNEQVTGYRTFYLYLVFKDTALYVMCWYSLFPRRAREVYAAVSDSRGPLGRGQEECDRENLRGFHCIYFKGDPKQIWQILRFTHFDCWVLTALLISSSLCLENFSIIFKSDQYRYFYNTNILHEGIIFPIPQCSGVDETLCLYPQSNPTGGRGNASVWSWVTCSRPQSQQKVKPGVRPRSDTCSSSPHPMSFWTSSLVTSTSVPSIVSPENLQW